MKEHRLVVSPSLQKLFLETRSSYHTPSWHCWRLSCPSSMDLLSGKSPLRSGKENPLPTLLPSPQSPSCCPSISLLGLWTSSLAVLLPKLPDVVLGSKPSFLPQAPSPPPRSATGPGYPSHLLPIFESQLYHVHYNC